MRIKSIKLKNFLSYADTEIDLINSSTDKPTITIIDGINLDSEGDNSSNGSGKSSLISETIFYNIYGKGLRGKSKGKLNELIRHSTDKMENEVEYFVKDENNQDSILNINRTKTLKSNNTNISLNDKEISKRTKALSDKDIVKFVDLSPEAFAQSVCYYPDNDNLFKLSYSQRLEFFKKMIDLSILDDYYNIVKDFKNKNEIKLYEINSTINATKEIVNIVEDNKDEYIAFLNKNINDLNNKLKEANDIKISDNTKYNDMLLELNEILKGYQKEYDVAHKNLLSKRSDIDKIQREINRFDKLSGIKCPTCNQIVTGDYVNSIIDEYKNQLEELNKGLKYQQELETDINNDIKETNIQIDKVNKKIFDIQQQIRDRENKIRLIDNQITNAKRDLDKAIKDSNNKEKVDKNKYQLKLKGFENALRIRDEWEKSITYWYDILSPKSILRSSLLKKYISILSDLFNFYLTKLYSDDIIATINIDDSGNIDLNIIHNGFEINYYNMSSGERKRMDIAMELALFKFIKCVNDNAPEFMILDEVLDNLDQDGIESVIKTINEFAITENIDIYVISHIPVQVNLIHDVNINHILVEKKNNISKARKI